jgi:hypothetical protein
MHAHIFGAPGQSLLYSTSDILRNISISEWLQNPCGLRLKIPMLTVCISQGTEGISGRASGHNSKLFSCSRRSQEIDSVLAASGSSFDLPHRAPSARCLCRPDVAFGLQPWTRLPNLAVDIHYPTFINPLI